MARHLVIGLGLLPLLGCIVVGGPALCAELTVREVRLVRADLGSELPDDLLAPEGRSRWDLTRLTRAASWNRTVRARSDSGELERVDESAGDGEATIAVRFSDPAGGDAARRWLFPDLDDVLLHWPGRRETLRLEQRRGESTEGLWIETERAGIGWVHLPSGPREVVLQRALVRREAERGFVPDRLIHRWVDPRAGVVAQVGGPVSPDGRNRIAIDEALFVDEVLAGAADLKIYVDELQKPTFRDLTYGRNRRDVCASGADEGNPCSNDDDCAGATNFCGALVSSLTPDGHTTIGQLIGADTWDFSGNTTGTEFSSTTVPINANETCNFDRCGYNPPDNRVMGRRDEDLGAGSLHINNDATERVDDVIDGTTIWLRAGTQRENESGVFGGGESSFCFVSAMGCDNDPGRVCSSDPECGADGPCVQFNRPEVPLWRFPNMDAGGWFMQPGDPQWTSVDFLCDQLFFNRTCGAEPLLGPADLWAKGCGDPPDVHDGRQYSEIVKGGVVTLPSGHTLNAQLVRNVTDICVYSGSPCNDAAFGNKVDEVRTSVYLWQVPHLGSVVMLQSEQDADDLTSYDKVAVGNFTFGLFPPLSIQVDGTTDMTVDLSWNPGNDTSRILDYVVYWDKDSGGVTTYEFNSLTHPGRVTFTGLGESATISGLDPDSDYFLTVTSRSDYTDPVSANPTRYESILYPTQVSGDPDSVYPVEVQAATGCAGSVPGREVQGLTVDKQAAGIEICWQASSSPCLVGYRVLGADSPEAAANFTPLADTGLETCWPGNPTQSYFLVVGRGAGGTGPWGHFGQ